MLEGRGVERGGSAEGLVDLALPVGVDAGLGLAPFDGVDVDVGLEVDVGVVLPLEVDVGVALVLEVDAAGFEGVDGLGLRRGSRVRSLAVFALYIMNIGEEGNHE